MKIFGVLFAVAASTVLVPTASAADQFDLVCEGTRSIRAGAPAEPHSYGFRVDLAAKRWCWQTCERVYSIQEVQPDRIVFQDESEDTFRKRSVSTNTVSRVNGEHRLLFIEVRPLPATMETVGQCTPAPFSGFPAAMF